jgi:hypothetical protein
MRRSLIDAASRYHTATILYKLLGVGRASRRREEIWHVIAAVVIAADANVADANFNATVRIVVAFIDVAAFVIICAFFVGRQNSGDDSSVRSGEYCTEHLPSHG